MGWLAWTAGNVSARAHRGGQDVFMIEPSGVAYSDLNPDAMVACDLEGGVVDGSFAPSDAAAAGSTS